MTYTYSILAVSPQTYREIKARMLQADQWYWNHVHSDGEDEVVDMHGIALKADTTLTP